MNADILINNSEPGLVPFGCLDVILPAVKDALNRHYHLDASEILNEWRGELYLDELNSDDFNGFIEILVDYLEKRQLKKLNSKVFVDFWNNLILPIIRKDDRCRNLYSDLK
jgi:hypothetical protein